ncbi:riboflavin synthase [Coralloluteibacterium thermophilus]|uniref:Riboflavin synthase n=1 Tax=Coralloluteibacterium thermophilum TaxID=2707049 RepID=A0ABV9NQE0_9GAMM
MFTGLIEAVGAWREAEPRGGDLRAWIDTGTLPVAELVLGESVAVNGVCLTVVGTDAAGFAADISVETLDRTTLGTLGPGRAVNLERALRADARLGGHLVAGHVDGIGEVVAIAEDGRGQRWRFRAPEALRRYIAEKGSVCVDGVSLTVASLTGDGFEVALVPHTLAHTAFHRLAAGDPVNLEIDLVARYVERLLGAAAPR